MTGAHVLLVEDNALNMEIAKFILEDAGIYTRERVCLYIVYRTRSPLSNRKDDLPRENLCYT